MKKIFILLSALFALVVGVGFLSCSNDDNDSGSSGNTNSSDNSLEKTTESKKVLYYNSTENAFVGTAKWTANTINDKVLLGYEGNNWGSDFIDSIVWTVDIAPDCSEVFYERTWQSSYLSSNKLVTYSIDKNTYTLTANLKVPYYDDGYDHFWYLKKMSQIPNAKITVTINFTTGQSTIIETQTGYEFTKNYIEEYLRNNSYIHISEIFIYVDGVDFFFQCNRYF